MASIGEQFGRVEITGGMTLTDSASVSTVRTSPTTLNGDSAKATIFTHLVGDGQTGSANLVPGFAKRPLPDLGAAGWEALSIFSGCGGLDLGFLQEGIFSRTAYDIDHKSLATYAENLPNVGVWADLSIRSPAPARGRILLAGAPCQGFSTVGRRQLEDPRNALLMRVADIAIENSSSVVIVENVPAAISGGHRVLWEALEDRLRLAGYNVRRLLLEGLSCGLGQRRKRLFLLCWRGSDCINVDLKTRPSLNVREALGGLDAVEDHDIQWPNVESREIAIARHIRSGQKISNVRISDRAVATWEIPEVYGATTAGEREILYAVARLRRRDRVRTYGDGDPVHLDRIVRCVGRPVHKAVDRLVKAGYLRFVGDLIELRQTYNGRYRRLEWDAPSPTVDTRFGRTDLFLHPEDHRGMTPREAARLQGFSDRFRFVGTRKEKFVQIGNAVPPPMASALAEFVREAILKA